MQTTEIIWKALSRLSAQDEYDKDNLTKINDRKIQALLFSLNAIIREITTDYLPLRHIQQVKIVDGYVGYEELKYHAVAVKRIKRNGKELDFRQGSFKVRVYATDGVADMEYDYSVGDITMEKEISLSRRVSDDVIVYGVLSDYCLTAGMTELALTYDRRYRDAMMLAMRDRESRRVASRGFYD